MHSHADGGQHTSTMSATGSLHAGHIRIFRNRECRTASAVEGPPDGGKTPEGWHGGEHTHSDHGKAGGHCRMDHEQHGQSDRVHQYATHRSTTGTEPGRSRVGT